MPSPTNRITFFALPAIAPRRRPARRRRGTTRPAVSPCGTRDRGHVDLDAPRPGRGARARRQCAAARWWRRRREQGWKRGRGSGAIGASGQPGSECPIMPVQSRYAARSLRYVGRRRCRGGLARPVRARLSCGSDSYAKVSAMNLVSAWFRIPFWQRVLAGFVLGALAGWAFGPAAETWFGPLGTLYVNADQDDRGAAGVLRGDQRGGIAARAEVDGRARRAHLPVVRDHRGAGGLRRPGDRLAAAAGRWACSRR